MKKPFRDKRTKEQLKENLKKIERELGEANLKTIGLPHKIEQLEKVIASQHDEIKALKAEMERRKRVLEALLQYNKVEEDVTDRGISAALEAVSKVTDALAEGFKAGGRILVDLYHNKQE